MNGKRKRTIIFPSVKTPFTSLSLSLPPCSDYGFKPADDLNGPCVRDEAVPLDDPCADGQVKTVMKSRGYRKVAGDICTSDNSLIDFDPYEFTCCNATVITISGATDAVSNNELRSTNVGLGVALGFAILVALALGIVAASFIW